LPALYSKDLSGLRADLIRAIMALPEINLGNLLKHLKNNVNISASSDWYKYLDGSGGGCLAALAACWDIPQVEWTEWQSQHTITALDESEVKEILRWHGYFDRSLGYQFSALCLESDVQGLKTCLYKGLLYKKLIMENKVLTKAGEHALNLAQIFSKSETTSSGLIVPETKPKERTDDYDAAEKELLCI